MTINIKKDRIEFVSNEGTTYTLRETGDGFSFDGVIEGTNIFQDGFQGTVAGFSSGGEPPVNTIDKFPFAVDTNATDVGDLTQSRSYAAGQSSSTHGYTSGGSLPPNTNVIDKFPFASNANATDVGDRTASLSFCAGHSSFTHGFTSGGEPPPLGVNTIDKFPFASDTNATDHGDMHMSRYGGSAHSSSVNGYSAGGRYNTPPQPSFNVISKFPFASNNGSNDVGDLLVFLAYAAGQSSTVSGYASGGIIAVPPPATTLNTIQKFPFATDTNATDVGDLSQARTNIPAGQSSTSSGYSSGGSAPPQTNVIDKFPFATDTNATDVGDLTQARDGIAGSQD